MVAGGLTSITVTHRTGLHEYSTWSGFDVMLACDTYVKSLFFLRYENEGGSILIIILERGHSERVKSQLKSSVIIHL